MKKKSIKKKKLGLSVYVLCPILQGTAILGSTHQYSLSFYVTHTRILGRSVHMRNPILGKHGPSQPICSGLLDSQVKSERTIRLL